MANVWAYSMACHPRATCHVAGYCQWWIQRHVIPEPRITLQGAPTRWIHCHDSRATCYMAGCSHLAKSMSWSCHLAGCNNSVHHIENRLSPYFIFFVFNGVWALTSGGFRIVSDTLVHGCHTDLSQHAETSGTRQTARISWTPQRLTQFLRVHRLLLHSSFRYFCSTKAELRDRCCLSVCLSVTPWAG